jgi:hypothetical protein
MCRGGFVTKRQLLPFPLFHSFSSPSFFMMCVGRLPNLQLHGRGHQSGTRGFNIDPPRTAGNEGGMPDYLHEPTLQRDSSNSSSAPTSWRHATSPLSLNVIPVFLKPLLFHWWLDWAKSLSLEFLGVFPFHPGREAGLIYHDVHTARAGNEKGRGAVFSSWIASPENNQPWCVLSSLT